MGCATAQYGLTADGVVETVAQALVTHRIVKPSSVLGQIHLPLDFIGGFLCGFLTALLPKFVCVPLYPDAVQQRQQGRQELNHSGLPFSASRTATRPAIPAMAPAAAL